MATCPSRALQLSLSLLCIGTVSAQWRPSPATTAPAPRTDYALAALPTSGLLLFGGDVGNPAATEWRWTGAEWLPFTTPVPRRAGAALANHPSLGLVAFGGSGAGGVPFTDTWAFDGLAWQQLNPVAVPPALLSPTMAYDASTDALVLVGLSGGTWSTWEYASGTWSMLPAATLPAAADVRLVGDTVRREVLAFAVDASGLSVHRLRQGGWLAAANQPGTFAAGAVAFDEPQGRAIWFCHPPGQPGFTFAWDGLRLWPRASAVAPPVLGAGQLAGAYDARRRETVVVASTFAMEVWSYADAAAAVATSHGLPCVDSALRLGLAVGDSPEPGGRHRLVVPGNNTTEFVFAMLGFSRTFDAGPLPRSVPTAPSCLQRVEVLAPVFLGQGLPASLAVVVPNAPEFLGLRYEAQFALAGLNRIVDVTNGLEVQIGRPLGTEQLVESFADATRRDPLVSGDVWGSGVLSQAPLGGDGRHGAFDAAIGTLVSPGVYRWNTDSVTFPATHTANGQVAVVTDGRYFLSELVVPAGITVEFVGSQPPQFHVRGRVEVHGSLQCNGAPMTTFNARGTTVQGNFVLGQSGGEPGAGGGRGGRGGRECMGTGPIVVNGVIETNGQPGEDVRIAGSHAYATAAVGTGGQGATMNPPTGVAMPNVPAISTIYRAYFAPGGSGGGYGGPGGIASVTPFTNLQIGATSPGGQSFPLFPFLPVGAPPGYSSLEHFLVGGSGGGGGATHAFGTFTVTGDVYIAGAGGSGGGGAIAVRAGGDVLVALGGSIQCRGGAGVLIRGNSDLSPNNTNWGIASPGGGGSGGSVLLQAGGNVAVHGGLDTSGGDGSRTGQVFTAAINVSSQAGAGSPGNYRLEAAGSVVVANVQVPAYNPATHQGVLLDRDTRSGSRSIWLLPPTVELPRYVRYEILAAVGGQTVVYSDDPAYGIPADDPNGAVYARFQGARVDPLTGAVQTATAGAWRSRLVPHADSINQDGAEAVRFDLGLDRSFGAVQVLEVRLLWR